MDKKTEAEIIARVLAGDQKAYALIIDEYKTAIYNLAYRMTNNVQDAQDLAQETFLRAYKNLASFDSRRSFFTWLYTLSLNLIRNDLKKAKRKPPLSDRESMPPGDISAADDQETTREELLEVCLAQLPPESRELIVLRYYQGLSFEEIADVTGLSVSAVKMRIYRGLERLKKIFEKV